MSNNTNTGVEGPSSTSESVAAASRETCALSQSLDHQPPEKRSKLDAQLHESTARSTHEDKSQQSAVLPLENIETPLANDYLLGGSVTSQAHIGNKKYRQLISKRKVDYMLSDRRRRLAIAKSMVQKWRHQNPPGRFLKRNTVTKLWHDVGDDSAKAKTDSLFNVDGFLEKQFGITVEKNGYPMKEILEPTHHDFLVERGAFLDNDHSGNITLRSIVYRRREEFQKADRERKQEIVSELVDEWRSLEPMGRFLAKGKNTIFWHDVGDDKAGDRIFQFLRGKPGGNQKPSAAKKKSLAAAKSKASKSNNTDSTDK